MKMLKIVSLLAVLAMVPVAASAQLVITGVMDGPLTGGLPKFVELFACSDIPDMSIYGLGCANNGGGTDGVEFTFPAVAVAGGTFIYCVDNTTAITTAFADYMGFAFDYDVGFAAGTNGDDATELFLVSGTEPVVIDVHGDINVDGTGLPWEYLDGWSKRNTVTGPDGSTFVIGNWSFSAPNANDGCLTNATCTSVYPVGAFLCDPAVPNVDASFGALKALYR